MRTLELLYDLIIIALGLVIVLGLGCALIVLAIRYFSRFLSA